MQSKEHKGPCVHSHEYVILFMNAWHAVAIVLGSRGCGSNERDKISCPHGTYILVEEKVISNIDFI